MTDRLAALAAAVMLAVTLAACGAAERGREAAAPRAARRYPMERSGIWQENW